MDTRVAALEADMNELKTGMRRIETSNTRIEATLASLATRADVLKVEETTNTIDVKVTELAGRVGRVETNVSTALNTAIGKAIGPVQFLGILTASAAIITAFAGAFTWMSHQPWFPH